MGASCSSPVLPSRYTEGTIGTGIPKDPTSLLSPSGSFKVPVPSSSTDRWSDALPWRAASDALSLRVGASGCLWVTHSVLAKEVSSLFVMPRRGVQIVLSPVLSPVILASGLIVSKCC